MADLFAEKAPRMMRDLMADIGMSALDAAAILGNIGHECNGFKTMQEVKPVVAGSRGGFGYAQWTGPRRRAFEAYAADKGLKPDSHEANYGFLLFELRGSERAAVAAVKKAATLADKVIAFEMNFERAGVKHYESRTIWAKRALAAFDAAKAAEKPAVKEEPPPPPLPAPEPPPPVAAPEDNSIMGRIKGWFR